MFALNPMYAEQQATDQIEYTPGIQPKLEAIKKPCESSYQQTTNMTAAHQHKIGKIAENKIRKAQI